MTLSASLKARRIAERPHPCESLCAPSDVQDASARHDREEERKTHVPGLQRESCYRGENLRHSNHSVLEENHDCTVWEGARESRELNRQQTDRSSDVQPIRHRYTTGNPTVKLKSGKQ